MKYMRSVGVYKHVWVQKGNAGPKNQAQMAFIREGLLWGRLWVRLKRGWLSGSQSRGKISPRIRAKQHTELQPQGFHWDCPWEDRAATFLLPGQWPLPVYSKITESQSHRAAGELRGKVLETGCGTQIFLQCRGAMGPWEESWRITALVMAGRLRNRREEELCSSPQGAPLLRNLCNRMG